MTVAITLAHSLLAYLDKPNITLSTGVDVKWPSMHGWTVHVFNI